MNAEANEQLEESASEGPGKQLKAIREAQGLELERVASSLRLHADKLRALEADDYSEMEASVFVQGYLRNYARLLHVDPEPVLEAFQQIRSESEREPDLRVAKIRHEVRSSHTLVRLFTWMIVIGLIALVLTWWRGYLQWPIPSPDEVSVISGEDVTDQPAEVTATELLLQPESGPAE